MAAVAAAAVAAVVSSVVTVVDVDAAVAAKPVAVLLAATTVSYTIHSVPSALRVLTFAFRWSSRRRWIQRHRLVGLPRPWRQLSAIISAQRFPASLPLPHLFFRGHVTTSLVCWTGSYRNSFEFDDCISLLDSRRASGRDWVFAAVGGRCLESGLRGIG